jgi:hypothetical protein
MQSLLADIAKVIARKTITEPLATGVSGLVQSSGAGGSMDSIGSWIGGLFRAEGGPVAAGQPYVVGERGPGWFVPNQGGTVIPNGVARAGPRSRPASPSTPAPRRRRRGAAADALRPDRSAGLGDDAGCHPPRGLLNTGQRPLTGGEQGN